ncbi:FAD:protein FMN transferase [Rodentibacter pneumotropicus]|uniref:FAD:protein FMN transferase n=1 Tax=Rodentibacter pneumotropicus TaxID=758 RepID=A0A4S2QFN3_9PAST|nr:FAD:protein FMN transferase [Rodentibacter pneumotropicus]NBH75420.1 FAD:protein FMN transferase [Rodentibacter pneumotropicus]OOF65302.1 thiamine biosynthesis protein ApbE [Rodentibacter pneumotropicus]THA02982.1 FAD:protein FMN transferase [Rodentibacter pneumotropicus]THA06145.1 FAD:protein FMN transferase [Rodentibacter pneumotropicus]THA11069.1 FAD:protein FMN transferase [Rodentibacter pneumotropicus]
MKKILSGLLVVAFACSLAACKKDPEVISLSGKTMGTTYHVKYIDDGSVSENLQNTHEQIEYILKDVNAKMSTYIKDSELSRFNQNTQVNTPIEISADFAKVLAEAIQLHQVTEGALDVTVGPVVNLWGFGPEKRPERQPTAEQLAERQAWVGLDKITLDMSGNIPTLSKSVPQVYIDLSSIAKGFGVDQVAEKLEQLNAQNYMVEIGGEIRAKGKNAEGKPWQIAIEKPNMTGERAVENVIGLNNMAMATSGDYRIYFEENGKRFAHEIDPKTGYPIQHHLASITVFSPTTMTADGLSTGLFVLGEEKALEVAEKNDIAIYLIIKTANGFETKISSAFKKLMETKD